MRHRMETAVGIRRAARCLGPLVSVGLMLSLVGVADASPFVPQDDHTLVETLRAKPFDREWQELRRLRAQLRAEPMRQDLAEQVGRRYIERSRAEADPRYLGQALAVLQPWLESETPPASTLLLRATIRQSLHNFDGALADLAVVLRAEPRNAQARLTEATIHQVQGRYAEARRACAPLSRVASAAVVLACHAGVGGLNGQGEAMYRLLQQALDAGRVVSRAHVADDMPERQWLSLLLAEQAERLGQEAEAERAYRAALAVGPRDPYTVTAYADFLLDRQRAKEALALLGTDRKQDGVLLRLALGEKQLGAPEQQFDSELLAARFEAARRRGEFTHGREEARYQLHLVGDAARALALAVDNWAIQREPADARIVLEAAIAADRHEAARPVVEWVRANRLEDVRLEALMRRVDGI